MKKFILLTLLASGLSAHAVGQASGQINTNQNEDSDEELNKAIELSLVDQAIEKEKRRENALSLSANTQRNNPVSEQIDTFQRNVQQNNLGFDEDCEEEAIRKAIEKENEEAIEKAIAKILENLTLEEVEPNSQNQCSVFKREEVASASAGTQEIPTEPNQNTRVIAYQNPQNRTYDERGMAEIHNVPYIEKVIKNNNILKVIFGCLFTERAHYITSLLNKKIREHFDLDFTKNDSAKYSHFKIQPALTFNVVLPPNIIAQLTAAIKWRKDSESNPIKSLTLASIQNVIALKEATQPPENEEAAKNLSNEEKNAIALKDAKIPEIAGSIADSRQNFLDAFTNNNAKKLPFDQWIKECFGTVSLEHIRITDSLTIAQANQLKEWAIPVKVDLIVDSWRNLWNAFTGGTPNLSYLPFDEWKIAYFGTVSLEKIKLHMNDGDFSDEGACDSFIHSNQAHLNPNNFVISQKAVKSTAPFGRDSEILLYLTDVTYFNNVDKAYVVHKSFKIFLQNNAPTLTHLCLPKNDLCTSEFMDFLAELSNLSNLKVLDLSKNNFSDDGLHALESALTNIRGLTYLDLSDNKISAKGAKYLKAIFDNNTLTTLSLSSNNIGAKGVKYLKAIFDNNTLTTLSLSSNNIGDKGASALSEAISQNSSLKEVHLSDNKISDEGAWDLANALRTNSSITRLNLSGNNISVEGVIALIEALSNTSTIKKLNLSGNDIRVEGVIALIEALSNNSIIKKNISTIKNLDLSGNDIYWDVAWTLKEICRAKKIDLEI